MADEGNTGNQGAPADTSNGGEGAPDAGTQKEVSFTKEQQAAIDRIVSERLKRQEQQFQKERDTEEAKRKEAERVVGATLEETKANVLALKNDVEAMAKAMVNQSAAKGSPPAPQGGDGGSELDKIRAKFMQAAGIKKQ